MKQYKILDTFDMYHFLLCIVLGLLLVPNRVLGCLPVIILEPFDALILFDHVFSLVSLSLDG